MDKEFKAGDTLCATFVVHKIQLLLHHLPIWPVILPNYLLQSKGTT